MSVNLNDVRVFVQVVELGSFSAAARVLHVTKSTVSRSIARLEEQLDTRLLLRSAQSLTPTTEGQAYYLRVSSALQLLMEANDDAVRPESPRGLVRLSAPVGVGIEALPRVIAKFVERYPHVQVELSLRPGTAHLVTEAFDLGIQGGPLPDSSWLTRKLNDTCFRLYASPTYVSSHGAPMQIHELSKHACLGFRLPNGSLTWRLCHTNGQMQTVSLGYVPVISDELTFIRQCTLEGMGIALLPDIPSAPFVARGALTHVLPEYLFDSSPLYLVYPSGPHTPLRVKVLSDFILEHFPRDQELVSEIFR